MVTIGPVVFGEAQVRILGEGAVQSATACDPVTADLLPTGPFGFRDLRCGA